MFAHVRFLQDGPSREEHLKLWNNASKHRNTRVKDLGASKRFYVDGLGWKPVYEDKDIIFFQTGGLVFALFLRDKLAADFHADPATFGRAAMSLAYNVRAKSDVDPLLERAPRLRVPRF